MKKLLLTLTAAGVLAVPVGMVAADDTDTESDEPVPTCEEHEREMTRERAHQEEQVGTQGQERAQRQLRTHDGTDDDDAAMVRVRERVQAQVEDGSGDMTRQATRERVQDRTDDADGAMVRDREHARAQDAGSSDMNQTRTRDGRATD